MSTVISIHDVNEPALLPGSLYRPNVNEHHYNAMYARLRETRETGYCASEANAASTCPTGNGGGRRAHLGVVNRVHNSVLVGARVAWHGACAGAT